MEFNTYQNSALSTVVYPEDMRVIYPALGLAGEAGEVANKIKKIYRDDGGVITPERRAQVSKELGGNLWYIAVLAADLGLSLDEIAQQNLLELAGRKEHGVIHGDGDNR